MSRRSSSSPVSTSACTKSTCRPLLSATSPFCITVDPRRLPLLCAKTATPRLTGGPKRSVSAVREKSHGMAALRGGGPSGRTGFQINLRNKLQRFASSTPPTPDCCIQGSHIVNGVFASGYKRAATAQRRGESIQHSGIAVSIVEGDGLFCVPRLTHNDLH